MATGEFNHQPEDLTVGGLLRSSFLNRVIDLDDRVRRRQTDWRLVDGTITNGVVLARTVIFPHPYSEGVQLILMCDRRGVMGDPGRGNDVLGEIASLTCVDYDGPSERTRRLGACVGGDIFLYERSGSSEERINLTHGIPDAAARSVDTMIGYLAPEPAA